VRTIVVSTEARFHTDPHGGIWVQGNENYAFFRRYLSVADRVIVVARSLEYTGPLDHSWKEASGENVEFALLPPSHGLSGNVATALSRRTRGFYEDLRRRSGSDSVAVVRPPGAVSLLTSRHWRGPLGAELVSDPREAFTAKALGRWWIPLLRPFVVPAIRRICWNARAVSYVTETTLQRQYPNRYGRQFSYSSVELPARLLEAGLVRTMQPYGGKDGFRVVFVGRLFWPLKGLDILLDALAMEEARRIPLRLDVVGGGSLLPEYRAQARRLGIESQITFHGERTAADVHRVLLASDIMVLPSRREGLPRAMIEAMACGLPCLATPVGGVEELLPPECILEPESPRFLARRLMETLATPNRLRPMGERNRIRVLSYEAEELQRRRAEFLSTLFENGQPEGSAQAGVDRMDAEA
jgi:glycosyltransferase involved in cell wall biosynthesis